MCTLILLWPFTVLLTTIPNTSSMCTHIKYINYYFYKGTSVLVIAPRYSDKIGQTLDDTTAMFKLYL